MKMLTIILTLLLFKCCTVSGQGEPDIAKKINVIKLCEVCTCSEIQDVDGGTHLVLNIQCSELDRIENVPDLDKIEWPANPNGLKISAAFEGLGLSSLSKLPPNPQVETLRFSNNAITVYWPDPFSGMLNLRKLSFYQNELKTITPDLFTDISGLEELDLSYNKLQEFNPLDFKTLTRLKRLNLQSNVLKKMPVDALQPMIALEDLDLSKNGIYDLMLQRTEFDTMTNVKRLNLNGNRIRSVMKDSFPVNNSIEILDLSNNVIEIVEEDAFLTCTSLRELNLAQNNITLLFALPPTLQIVILKINMLYHWPKFPSAITYIDLSYNRLSDIYDERNMYFDNLEVLNIGGNQIKQLNIEKKLPKLFSLDLSYNLLSDIPISLSSQNFPNLEELRLDGNPITNIYFKNIIALKILYLNDLNNMTVVEEKAFSNVIDRDGETSNNGNCFSLYLSNCHSLKEIREGAFDGTSLCMLDISHNNLTYLPRSLTDWSRLSEGVNLQFNPWACDCGLQWILDELLPLIYTSNSLLLTELRCGSPRAVEGLRLVHWYNWTERVMCSDVNMRSGPHGTYLLEPSTQGFDDKVDKITIILGVSIVLSLLIAIALTVYLVKSRRRHRIRQAALKRKRQSAADAKNTSPSQKEQFSALNKA